MDDTKRQQETLEKQRGSAVSQGSESEDISKRDRGVEPLSVIPQAPNPVKTCAGSRKRPDRALTKPQAEPPSSDPPQPACKPQQKSTSNPPADPDLARIVAVWSELAEPIKRAMVALVEAAGRDASNPHGTARKGQARLPL